MLYSSGVLYFPVLLFYGVRSLGQEIPLHLELPNLLVELGNEGLVLLFLLTALTTKDARSTLQQSPLPCANLARDETRSDWLSLPWSLLLSTLPGLPWP